jgi:hypothetical protein
MKAAAILAAWLRQQGITGEDVRNMSDAQYALACNLGRMEGLGPSRKEVISAMEGRQQQPGPDFRVRLAALEEETR